MIKLYGVNASPFVRKVMAVLAIKQLDYVEGEVPAEGFQFDDLTVADLALASPLVNAGYAQYTIDTEYLDGPFRPMRSNWAFRDVDGG